MNLMGSVEPDGTIHFSPIRESNFWVSCTSCPRPEFFNRDIMIISHLYGVTVIICIMLKVAATSKSFYPFCFLIIVKNRSDSVDVAQVG